MSSAKNIEIKVDVNLGKQRRRVSQPEIEALLVVAGLRLCIMLNEL